MPNNTILSLGSCLECLSNKHCNTTYSTCVKGACKCKDELIKEGKFCKNGEKYNFKGASYEKTIRLY